MCTGCKSWDHEVIFNREPVQMFAVAMTTNRHFLGTKEAKLRNISGIPG